MKMSKTVERKNFKSLIRASNKSFSEKIRPFKVRVRASRPFLRRNESSIISCENWSRGIKFGNGELSSVRPFCHVLHRALP